MTTTAASPKAHRTYSLEDDRQIQEARRIEVAPPQPKTEEDRP